MRSLQAISLGFCIFLLCSCAGQNLRRKKRHHMTNHTMPHNNTLKEHDPFASLMIDFPLNFLRADDHSRHGQWRTVSTISQSLVDVSSRDPQSYKSLARARRSEDIWLYENWFYGMTSGVIMESGALDGLLFSTSFMFERFANWTSIHIGKHHTILN